MTQGKAQGGGNKKQLQQRLQVSGGIEVFERIHRCTDDAASRRRYNVYRAVSYMRSAMRERADDHKRSTERVDTCNTSAVSAVVKPAK